MSIESAPDLGALQRRIEARYREIAVGPMADVPICNRRLSVAALGFRAVGEEAVGAVITPWFLSIVATPLLPGVAAVTPARPGETRKLSLPAGVLDMIVGELEGIGRLDAASIVSPMQDFPDMQTALAAAEFALKTLFTPPEPPALDRRALLRGKFSSDAD